VSQPQIVIQRFPNLGSLYGNLDVLNPPDVTTNPNNDSELCVLLDLLVSRPSQPLALCTVVSEVITWHIGFKSEHIWLA
jgi:hypothetical protein